MTELVSIRASEILDQGELVIFLKTRFPNSTKYIGRMKDEGMQTVETRVPPHSSDFEEIREFIVERRCRGVHGFSDFAIGQYLRKYTRQELQTSEVLKLSISTHFEPCGEECGTIYETLCNHCNWGRQISDLVLDLRRIPQQKDASETIAWVEWVISERFVETVRENQLTGANFRPVLDLRYPTRPAQGWQQLQVIGSAGPLAQQTVLGKDPFSPGEVSWQCPLGHSRVTDFLSELHLYRNSWDGSDIAATSELFGQGQNLLRPIPLIIISQKMYRALESVGIRGFSYERVHLH